MQAPESGSAAAKPGMPSPPQVCPPGQPPQSAGRRIRRRPRRSIGRSPACKRSACTRPSRAPSRRRSVIPSPPQVGAPAQPPQSIWPPQPSPTMPQYLPFACWQLVGVHAPESEFAPQTFARPAPPQVCPSRHPPQSTEPPQPSPTMPQYLPFACVQLRRVHAPESGAKPQRFGMPSPPQLWPAGHPPQSIWPPQPSPTMPQYWPFG